MLKYTKIQELRSCNNFTISNSYSLLENTLSPHKNDYGNIFRQNAYDNIFRRQLFLFTITQSLQKTTGKMSDLYASARKKNKLIWSNIKPESRHKDG